jgi:2-polyprenyl-3-methyl-5-hydroxy-6-metoxy-1,4-benzoquinol methylase
MSTQNRTVFERLYSKAKRAEDLPWHHADPPKLLLDAMASRTSRGNAIDIGCGAGTYSLYMARHGYQVTAIDFMPAAIDMLRAEAGRTGLRIDAVQADVTTWEAPRRYDLVLDVGCLHSLGRELHAAYKSRLLQWLAPGGSYVLVHLGRRAWWDWWPIGPNRISADEVTRMFAPELALHRHEPEPMTGMPLFMGRSAVVDRYWFIRE